MDKRYIIYLICVFVAYTANAQILFPDLALNDEFKAQVKSLDEFQARFNGTEYKPNTELGNDSLTRIANLMSLFDFQMDTTVIDRNILRGFIDSVMQNNIQFNMLSHDLWAECDCSFKYKGKTTSIILYMQKELYRREVYRWAIVSVHGLDSTGIINSERFYSISPVEHEIHFMGLQDLLNENPSQAFGYRSKSKQIDQLSVFLTLVHNKAIKFEQVEELTFHYLGVPGYVFTIKEFNRVGRNSGWLINHIQTASGDDKIEYINKINHYEH